MSNPTEGLEEILAPVPESVFFAEYYDRRPLHVRAPSTDKFADVMSWQILSEILNMTSIWSPASLKLVLDTETIQPPDYCRETVDRDNRNTLQPVGQKVKALLRRGASLVANDIDTLRPGLARIADALEASLNCKAQSNLYCSWLGHQAFDVHFDTHDVFALHAEGEKTWRVYKGRIDRPIAHAMFKNLPKEHSERHKGDLMMEVTLRPGDVLYIPRGYYHEAMASTAGTVHVSFGLTYLIGIDLLALLYEQVFADPLFRTNLPRAAEGDGMLSAHLKKLAARLEELAASDAMVASVKCYRDGFHYHRSGFNLPADILQKRSPRG